VTVVSLKTEQLFKLLLLLLTC